MPNPFLAAIGASVGSVALMGAATMAVSGTALAVVQKVTASQRKKRATLCTVCAGTGMLRCQICMGKGIIKARAPRTMKQLLEEARSRGKKASSSPPVDLICPGCGSTLEQRCLNCLGEGKVALPAM